MKTRIVIALVAALAVTSTLMAVDLPPGKWWRNPGIAGHLNLQPEQQSRLDAIFRDSANELIDQRAELEKLTLAVRGELDQPQLNRQNLQRLAEAVTKARGRLFERELMMLVDMRGVLNEEQWASLRAQIDRRRDMQQRRPLVERGRPQGERGRPQGERRRPRPQ